MDEETKKKEMFRGKTFDDFLLCPQLGKVAHRGEVDLSTQFSKNITLHLPLAAANMDTVTGPEMCIALAQEGGIGILPRHQTIEAQAQWVKQVKRAENFIIENPYTILDNQIVGEAKREMDKRGVGTLLVVDERQELVGMITRGRMLLCLNEQERVEEWMIRRMSGPLKFSQKKILSAAEAREELIRWGAEKLPLVYGDFKIRGLITAKDINRLLSHTLANKDDHGHLRVGAAIGATGDYLERAAELIKAGADVLVMDVAHAHNQAVIRPAVENFYRHFKDFELVAGNVATGEAVEFLGALGVKGIKVGIGPGFGCRTRLEIGVGVPQAMALRLAWPAAQRRGLPIISDGGIKRAGQIAIALLLGASSVMVGSFLAGTEETPGPTIRDPATGIKYKIYRGMTSPEAKLGMTQMEGGLTNIEGQEQRVPYRGSVKELLLSVRQSLQSMVSYAGEKSLEVVRQKINSCPEDYLILLSEAARRESFER